MQLNYSTALFLLNPKLRAIMCSYEAKTDKNPSPAMTMFKTFDETIAVDDLVIVPSSTRHHRTIVRVAAIDVEVDFDSQTQVDWIVGKYDSSVYEKLVRDEAAAIGIMKNAEAKARRDEIIDKVAAFKSEELKKLPIAGGQAIAPPTAK